MESNQENIYAYCTSREHNLYSNIFILKHRYSNISHMLHTLFITAMPRTWKKSKAEADTRAAVRVPSSQQKDRPINLKDNSAESFQLVGAVASLPQFQRETLYTGRFFALGESWLNYRKQHKDVKPLGFSLLILKRLYQTLVRKRVLKLLAEKAVKSYKMKVNRAAAFGIEI